MSAFKGPCQLKWVYSTYLYIHYVCMSVWRQQLFGSSAARGYYQSVTQQEHIEPAPNTEQELYHCIWHENSGPVCSTLLPSPQQMTGCQMPWTTSMNPGIHMMSRTVALAWGFDKTTQRLSEACFNRKKHKGWHLLTGLLYVLYVSCQYSGLSVAWQIHLSIPKLSLHDEWQTKPEPGIR